MQDILCYDVRFSARLHFVHYILINSFNLCCGKCLILQYCLRYICENNALYFLFSYRKNVQMTAGINFNSMLSRCLYLVSLMLLQQTYL